MTAEPNLYRDEPPPGPGDLAGQIKELDEALAGAQREIELLSAAPPPYTLKIDGHPLAAETTFGDALFWQEVMIAQFAKYPYPVEIKIVTA